MKAVCRDVCVFVFRHAAEAGSVKYLLLADRDEDAGRWEPLIGRVEKQELAEDAARRCVLGETGLAIKELIVLDKVHVCFRPGKKRVYFEPCFGIDIGAGEPVRSVVQREFIWLDYRPALDQLSHADLRDALSELHAKLSVQP